jgi:hypothetical protein
MSDSLNVQVRHWIGRYLKQEISVDDLMAWLGPVAWNLPETVDEATRQLVDDVVLQWAEFTNGDWTDDEFRQALSNMTAIAMSGTR